jgi:diguanylate cyclase (GGDEF)-like protein/PAS domain S-box-containing protein
MNVKLNFEKILDHLSTGIMLIDEDENIIYINKLVTEITGYDIKEFKKQQQWCEYILPDPDQRRELRKDFKNKLSQTKHYNNVFSIKTKSGEQKDLEFRAKLLEDNYLLVNILDVSEKILREKEVQEIKERLEIAVEAADIGIWDWNFKSGRVYYNKKWAEMLGYQHSELKNHISTWEELVYSPDKKYIEEQLNSHLNGEDDLYYSEHRLKSKSGDLIWIRDVGKVIERDEAGNPIRAIGVHINIDNYKKREKEIEYLSFHDGLTGLYNRRYLENEMYRLNNSRQYPITIIIGDLDHLKKINDQYGHNFGDQYLIKSAKILEEVLRSEDIAARAGGDEFAVLLPNTDQKASELILSRIRDKFNEYNQLNKFPIPLSMSLGFYTLKNNKQDIYYCYNRADKEMYKNKEKNCGS